MAFGREHDHQYKENSGEKDEETIGTKLSHHNFEITNVGHLECSNVRLKLSCPRGDEMRDIDINAMIR